MSTTSRGLAGDAFKEHTIRNDYRGAAVLLQYREDVLQEVELFVTRARPEIVAMIMTIPGLSNIRQLKDHVGHGSPKRFVFHELLVDLGVVLEKSLHDFFERFVMRDVCRVRGV